MWFELIITILLGGILFILLHLARQRNSNRTKSFKVTYLKNKRPVLLKYTSFQSFSEKCKATFNLGNSEKLYFATAENANRELDKECLEDLEDSSLLIVEGKTTTDPDNDNADDVVNDDYLESDVLGSNSVTDDTVVDNADRQKWKDKQAGKATFDLGNVEEDANVELDKECLEDLDDKSSLIVKGEITTWLNGDGDDADDRNDDGLGFDILGSDSFTDTVVDNADIQKWEDIQAGNRLKEHIAKYGLNDITNVLKENLDAWKSKPLNIAVTGESGKGKSSFINAFLGLSVGRDDAAEIDEEECTKFRRAFRHPKYDSFVLWDVPGVGTKSFPKETYLNDIESDKYDFFMILSSNRFSELDSWLAKEILKRERKFYFIRTKIDIDMSQKKNRFRDLGQKFDENEEFDQLKSRQYEKLYCDVQGKNLQFFMISNNHPTKYDFPLILNQLLQDVPDGKKVAMMFGLAGTSKDIIVEKVSALKSRIWKVAFMSGAWASIPFPLLPSYKETSLILEEILMYRDQLGLDDQSLKNLADMAGISLEQLKMSVRLKTPADWFTSEGVIRNLMKCSVWEVLDSNKIITIATLGIAIPYCKSFYFTVRILECLLEVMKKDAQNVLLFVSSRVTETD